MPFQSARPRRLALPGAAFALFILPVAVALALPIAGAPDRPPERPSRGALTPGTWALTNVHVVPMTADTVIRDAAILIRDGRIAAVGRAADLGIPAGTRTVDGRGRYVTPGLADMHTHLYSDGVVHDSAGPAELGVMLANGVTAARLMIGTPEQLILRGQVEDGSVVGPQLWVASPHFTTDSSENARVVTTPAEVRAAVREVDAAGYDFVKITFGIDGPLYDALVDEARRRDIGVVGHVEPAVGVRRAIAAGQQLEHLDSYFEAALADSAPMTESLTQFRVYRPASWASLDYIDDAKLTAIAEETARTRTWVVPTLEIFNRAFSVPLSDAELRALPDWNMIPADIRQPYLQSRARYWAQPVPREQRARFAEIRNSIVKRIADAGGADRIMAGSDSPDLLMAYGWAMHRELAHLVQAGLTPYQALAAGTRNPAEFLGAAREWGTVAVGRRADLLLLEGNPLEEITNIQRIAAVAIGGRWIERPELDAMIERGRRAIDGAPVGAPGSGTDGVSVRDTVGVSSAVWLSMLPDGETKRRFILDCTGCHQFDARIATPDGRPRTQAEWTAAITRMLGYAGPTTDFPVISSATHPDTTAAWLARYITGSPAAAPPSRRAAGTVTEFLFPHPQDLPHDVAIDSSGDIVVTGMFSHAMQVLDPATGAWRAVPIPVPQANPRAVEIDRRGRWWVVLGGPNRLAMYDGLQWRTFEVGVYAHSVALDSNGGAWVNGHFTRDPERIVEIDGDGTRRDYDLPRHPTMASQPGGPIPYELRTAPDGSIWMSELQGNRMIRLDPTSGAAAAFELPTPSSGPRRHDVAPDGVVWIPAYAGGSLVRFDPRAENFEEIPLPVRDALPYVVRVDAKRDRVWVGTGAADELFAYRPSVRSWERYPLPSHGAMVRHLAIDPQTGDVWLAYGESPGKIPARIARLVVSR